MSLHLIKAQSGRSFGPEKVSPSIALNQPGIELLDGFPQRTHFRIFMADFGAIVSSAARTGSRCSNSMEWQVFVFGGAMN